ncbi:UvrD-helicase domain-containing protein [Aeromonas bestiarum]|jgi:DNA helicase II / ATP-dependent DNA helicase PcrA|uniref:UvrD-helicase domain-containing protein n=1 Tax=Aeromonas bestiarum TaxID=105751 RepID=UPI00259DBE0B|nr:UvrD-helicase domain-containing protein [Aeromonas bestiarum]MDM5087925.1 UvrD-helicase domain-containing protein [Aeromonas bestiarum]
MSDAVIHEGNDRDAGVVEEICGYLTEQPPRSFFLFAGAGSGKTRTLVEVLRRLTGVVPHEAGGVLGHRLRLAGRSIRVVTFTKNAVAVINGRLGNNELVSISTIHSFCWELINGFDADISAALVAIKQAELEKAQTTATSKKRGVSASDLVKFAEIEAEIDQFSKTERFIYHPDRNTFGPGAIQHRHVLDATAWLLLNRPTLRTILCDRHPIILIDESQDTMKGILDALMELAKSKGCGLTLGLLGDHRQRIYSDGHSDLPGLVPEGWAKPELLMNHRSQRRIVTLINNIWESKIQGRTQSATGVRQHPRTEKTGGLVRLFIGDASLSSEDKRAHEHWCADQMQASAQDDAWKIGGYQLLALEHKLVAARGGFLRAYEAMALIDPNAAAPVGSGENNGPSAARLVLDELAQLQACIRPDGTVNESAATDVLRRAGSLEHLPVDATKRHARTDEMLKAIQAFANACIDKNSSVSQVIEPILGAQLFEVHPSLADAFADKSPPPPPPVPRKTTETTQERMRRGWCALFAAPWGELGLYLHYLAGNSDLATHQVVKGSEFANVMVVMDDCQAGGFLISYDKLFGGKEPSDTDMSNVDAGKETTIDRSLRLLYVTCSRARESLALVLWSEQPSAAISYIKENSNWFSPEEIIIIP